MKETLSTGVLRKEPGTASAVINLSNVGQSTKDVTVEVWNWSSYSNPVQLPVLIGNNVAVDFPYQLAPENLAVMYTNLTGVLFYEIRIIRPKGENLIVNCFGRSTNLTAQEGNTVLNNQLVKIKDSSSCVDILDVIEHFIKKQ
jgi:hypothetical protein